MGDVSKSFTYGGRDIRNISSGIGLASHIDLIIFNAEDGLKVLEELDEILSNLLFRGGCYLALGKTGPDGLLHPQNVGEIDPSPIIDL